MSGLGGGGLNSENEGLARLIEGQSDINGLYRDVRRLENAAGVGQFSLVFSAEHVESGRRVCIKVHVNGDDYRRECFVRESSLLERLAGQPDILPLVEPRREFVVMVRSANADEIPFRFQYFVTELADVSVRDVIYGVDRSAMDLIEIFRGICRGVQRIHDQGICHRDLKPDNCLIGPQRASWLGDFGTARDLVNDSALREEYSSVMWRGDARYTSPELVCGIEKDELFLKGDFYSLGAILYEIFTRATLFNSVFDLAFVRDLARHFAVISIDERGTIFDELIPSIISVRPLPSIRQVPNIVPAAILDRVDRLYLRLADLDYRQRLSDFRSIFRELNACSIILRREQAYLAWRRSQREIR